MLKLNTAPTVEPISTTEAKNHLRIDSEDIASDLSTSISIAPGSHAIAASYSLQGSSVSVSGYKVLVNLIAGDCSSGTVDVKLQESNNGTTWTDVTSGSFTQVTASNDNAIQEKEYTGSYAYIRAVATVGTAACEFGVTVVKDSPYSTENDLIDALVTAVRQDCESFQGRSYITQTWELWLDDFPGGDYIELPRPPVQSVTSVKYYDASDTEATFSSDDYFVDTKSEPGRLCLNYGESWPSATLRPFNGVCITYVTGYGDAASDVPDNIILAMKLMLGHYYENREAVLVNANSVELPMGAKSLLWKDRVL